MAMGAVNDVTEETLRDLAQIRAREQTVLSLYLDLDPAWFATGPARATEIDSLLDGAHREVEAGERPRRERQELRRALAHARELLEEDRSWTHGAHAVALFLCEPLALSRLLRLPHPVSAAWIIADVPFIAPLAESGPVGRVCVALVDERFARILRGSAEALREVVSFGDPVPGRHKQGGWSQARYQRSQYEGAEAHLRRAARMLHDLLRVSPYDRLLIACTAPLWRRAVAKLHADVRERLHSERLSLDVGDASVEDVVRASAPALAAEQRAREDAVLAELREHQSRDGDGRAAVGLEAVLGALVQRRVAALLYDARLRLAGVVCARCGWMGADGDRCPLDGAALKERESILDDAVHSAVTQSAEVMALRDRPELGPLGGIAATLRF
jgi:peptide chain release factor subunit 1